MPMATDPAAPRSISARRASAGGRRSTTCRRCEAASCPTAVRWSSPARWARPSRRCLGSPPRSPSRRTPSPPEIRSSSTTTSSRPCPTKRVLAPPRRPPLRRPRSRRHPRGASCTSASGACRRRSSWVRWRPSVRWPASGPATPASSCTCRRRAAPHCRWSSGTAWPTTPSSSPRSVAGSAKPSCSCQSHRPIPDRYVPPADATVGRMKTAPIILVPGFWLGGWAWDEVADILRKDGHDVTALTLPGLESADADRSSVHAEDHVRAIVDSVRAAPAPVVLAVHSASGFPGYAASDRVPDRIAAMVYVDTAPGKGALEPAFPDKDKPLKWDELTAEENLDGLSDEQLRRFRERGVPVPG